MKNYVKPKFYLFFSLISWIFYTIVEIEESINIVVVVDALSNSKLINFNFPSNDIMYMFFFLRSSYNCVCVCGASNVNLLRIFGLCVSFMISWKIQKRHMKLFNFFLNQMIIENIGAKYRLHSIFYLRWLNDSREVSFILFYYEIQTISCLGDNFAILKYLFLHFYSYKRLQITI